MKKLEHPIKIFLRAAGLKMKDFAAQIGKTPASICNYTSGKRTPSWKTAKEMVKVMDRYRKMTKLVITEEDILDWNNR